MMFAIGPDNLMREHQPEWGDWDSRGTVRRGRGWAPLQIAIGPHLGPARTVRCSGGVVTTPGRVSSHRAMATCR